MERKVAVITGSTSGIGLAIAQKFAHLGHNVVLNGFGDKAVIQELVESLSIKGAKAIHHPANMLEPKEIKDLIDKTNDQYGRLDILVNNAGIQHVAPIEEFPLDKWDAIIGIDLSAAFHTTRWAFPLMKQNHFGRIINIASAHALVASPFKSAYVAAKHGLLGLTKVIALEGATHNIRCNAICPGYVKTPLVENQIADTAKARGLTRDQVIHDVLLGAQPTKEFITSEQIAELCAFLISEHATSITGAALPIDGGWTCH